MRRIGAAVIPVCLLVDLPPGSAVRFEGVLVEGDAASGTPPAAFDADGELISLDATCAHQVSGHDGMVQVIPSWVPAPSPAPVAP